MELIKIILHVIKGVITLRKEHRLKVLRIRSEEKI